MSKEDRRSFKCWEKMLNAQVLKQYGVCLMDLPDMTYHDWFKSEFTIQAAMNAIEEELHEAGYLS